MLIKLFWKKLNWHQEYKGIQLFIQTAAETEKSTAENQENVPANDENKNEIQKPKKASPK